MPSILAGYAEHAQELVPRFESLSTAEILTPVRDLLPGRKCLILDIGAGSGRDAAWFAAQGHAVTAVEPVAELRKSGMAFHPAGDIVWVNDQLPELARVSAAALEFDLILLNGVWQHLPPADQPAVLATLARLLRPLGRTIISVRHGPGAANRPCYPADIRTLERDGLRLGLTLIRKRRVPSIQQENRDAGVEWTWMCWERGHSE